MDAAPLTETFQINNRINLYLLDAIPEEYFADLMTSKGRNVGNQFAHIHNVRLMWLKVSSPDLWDGLEKIEKDQTIDKELITRSLTGSAAAIETLIGRAAENDGKVKGFKPHVTAFVGYLIAHDAHHRSQAIIALKQSGHKVDQKIGYGIWEWGTR